jgi:hypothetical protein
LRIGRLVQCPAATCIVGAGSCFGGLTAAGLVLALWIVPAARRRNSGWWVVGWWYCMLSREEAYRTMGGDQSQRPKLSLDVSALDMAGRGARSGNGRDSLGHGRRSAVGLCCRRRCGRGSRPRSGRMRLNVNAAVRRASVRGPGHGLAPQRWRAGPVLARALRRGRLSRHRTALRLHLAGGVWGAGHLVSTLGRCFR